MDGAETLRIEIDDEASKRLAALAQTSGMSHTEAVQRIMAAGVRAFLNTEQSGITIPEHVPAHLSISLSAALDLLARLSAEQVTLQRRVALYRKQMAELEDAVEPLSREARTLMAALRRCREELEPPPHA